MLAKLHDCVSDVTARMDRYDVAGACASVRGFCDVLTNWYVRRSRDRFWAGERDAIDTLHTVLEVTCRLAAPLLPLTTEAIWRGLTAGRSVHLTDWPDPASLPARSGPGGVDGPGAPGGVRRAVAAQGPGPASPPAAVPAHRGRAGRRRRSLPSPT